MLFILQARRKTSMQDPSHTRARMRKVRRILWLRYTPDTSGRLVLYSKASDSRL